MSSEVDFDVIVIGAGVAGSVCAYLLAQQGYEVLLAERGSEPGTKNLSGGVFYCRIMEQILPGFTENAPVERVITRNCLSFLNAESAVNIDYWDARLSTPVNAVTVLRAKLDPWLAEQCEEAGVTLMPGIRVDGLIREGSSIVGIRAGEEELRSRVVVAADGVNSFISQDAGIRDKEPLNHLAVGVKSVIRIGEQAIRERFRVADGEGAAYAVTGDCTEGVAGGGFMYTNKDSVSIGIVVRLDALKESGKSSSDLHDHFLTHPAIAPYLEGGELLEYGCHMVAEGGQAMQHDLVRPGLVVIGDAAGFTLNTGFTLRGMDLAAGSAQAAAVAIGEALTASDTSQEFIEKAYVSQLNSGFVGQDMHTYARATDLLDDPEMYGQIGDLLAETMYGLYNHDLTPRAHAVSVFRRALRGSGMKLRSLMRVGWHAVRGV